MKLSIDKVNEHLFAKEKNLSGHQEQAVAYRIYNHHDLLRRIKFVFLEKEKLLCVILLSD